MESQWACIGDLRLAAVSAVRVFSGRAGQRKHLARRRKEEKLSSFRRLASRRASLGLRRQEAQLVRRPEEELEARD